LRPGSLVQTHSQATRQRGLGNSHSVSHQHWSSSPLPNSGQGPAQPDATKSLQSGPGIKRLEHGLNVPKVNQTEGLGNPHSVRRQQPNQPPARNPPLSDANKSLQLRGDRDSTPTHMAVITVEGRHSKRSPDHPKPDNNRHHHARADGVTAAQDERPSVSTLVLGTQLSPLLEGLGPPPARPSPRPGGSCPRSTNSARTTSRPVTRTSRRTGDSPPISPPTPHHVLGTRRT
jgi:hypothetical protein